MPYRIKAMHTNKPATGQNGQYVYNDDIEVGKNEDYFKTDGLPPEYDKFDKKALYTVVTDDPINRLMVKEQIQFSGTSYIEIDGIVSTNAGISHWIKDVRTSAWIFDSYAYDGNPMSDSFSNIKNTLDNDWLFFDYKSGGLREGKSPGRVLKDQQILKGLSGTLADTQRIEFTNDNNNFEPTEAFQPVDHEGDASPFMTSGQKIYIVIKTSGNADRWWGTDTRKKRYHVYEIDSSLLYDENGNGHLYQQTFDYSDAQTKTGDGGGGGAEAAAFKITELTLTIQTSPGLASQSLSAEASAISGSIETPLDSGVNLFSSNKLLQMKSFLKQNPYKAVNNLNNESGTYLENIIKDFEPVTNLTIKGFKAFGYTSDDIPNIDLQAYQRDNGNSSVGGMRAKIASTPGEVELNFYISHHRVSSGIMWNNTDTYRTPNTDFKFYVLNWDDKNNIIRDNKDFINDMPQNTFELIDRQNQNLYIMSDLERGLTHTYRTPGIKTIKAVIFKHTVKTNNLRKIQPVHWKFVKCRLFLDIPMNEYPDFGELGGDDFATLPWPNTVPIIGGIDENSKYSKSIYDVLGGGKIDTIDYIDEKFLLDARDNDELGQTIQNYDLEQTRFFNSGDYDMNRLLGIKDRVTTDGSDFHPYNDLNEDGYWNCKDWDSDRNYCFSEESSVGQIFISDNSDVILKQSCKIELNSANGTTKVVYDSSGNQNKGMLIGDYKISKREKGQPMRRDSYIKRPQKSDIEGAI
jgi:hypothetical protein